MTLLSFKAITEVAERSKASAEMWEPDFLQVLPTVHLGMSYQMIWLNKIFLSLFNNIFSQQSSSSSCRAASTDIPDPLSQPVSIVHRFRRVLKSTSCIGIELLYVGSSWSSCLCSSMWRGPQEYIAYEFVPTSPVVSRMSGSSNLDSFRDGW